METSLILDKPMTYNELNIHYTDYLKLITFGISPFALTPTTFEYTFEKYMYVCHPNMRTTHDTSIIMNSLFIFQ